MTNALVPASTEIGTLPPGYLAGLQHGYSAFGSCGGAVPDATRVFVSQDAAGLYVLYRGFDVTWSASPIRGVLLQGFVDRSLANLTADPRLSAPSSIYFPGSQLPYVAPWRFGASVGWEMRDARTELLLKGIDYSRNNQNNLPAYALWSAGLEQRLSPPWTLDLVVRNVGHAYTGLFTSPRYAVPIPTQGGSPLLENAAPLPAPDAFLRLRLSLGGG